jgi:hypothetical protein
MKKNNVKELKIIITNPMNEQTAQKFIDYISKKISNVGKMGELSNEN